ARRNATSAGVRSQAPATRSVRTKVRGGVSVATLRLLDLRRARSRQRREGGYLPAVLHVPQPEAQVGALRHEVLAVHLPLVIGEVRADRVDDDAVPQPTQTNRLAVIWVGGHGAKEAGVHERGRRLGPAAVLPPVALGCHGHD